MFTLEGNLLEMVSNKNCNVDFDILWDKKLKYNFAKEKCFAEKTLGNKRTRVKTFLGIFQPPATIAGFLKTKLSSKPKTNNHKTLTF